MVDWDNSILYSEVLDKRVESLRVNIEEGTTTTGLACRTLWLETCHVCGILADASDPDMSSFMVAMYNRLKPNAGK